MINAQKALMKLEGRRHDITMGQGGKDKASQRIERQCKVCAKHIRQTEETFNVYHSGQYYAVCCPSCAQKFEAAPKHYLFSTNN